MPGPTPLPVRLTDKQRAELLLLREDDNSRLRARATIIMACAEGLSNNEVARRENITPATVARWRRAFCGDGCQRRSKSTPLAGVKMHHLMRFSPALAVVPVVHRRDARCFV